MALDTGGPDGPDGIVLTGTFVTPDAATCTLSNPAFMSPKIGTTVVIGATGWWDDGFMTPTESARTSEAVNGVLEVCPAAPEFWEFPLFSGNQFELGDAVRSDEIEGYSTTRIDLTPRESVVELEEAAIWVTNEGWPIRMHVEGSAPGGFARFTDLENDDPELIAAFELGFDLTDINYGGLFIRAPDGSGIAGPIGEVVAHLPEFEPLSPDLRATVLEVSESECAAANVPWMTLARLGDAAGFGHFSVATSDPTLPNLTNVYTLTFTQPDFDARVISSADANLARDHAILYFGHITPLVVIWLWTGLGPDSVPVVDGRFDFAVWDGSGDDAARVATWDGFEITFDEDNVFDLPYGGFINEPPGGIQLTDAEVAEGWERALEWVDFLLEATAPLPSGDLVAVEDLRAITQELDYLNGLACSLLAAAWIDSEAAWSIETALLDNPELAIAEMRAESLLLFLDYVGVAVNYMELPGVKWLDAEGLELRNNEILPDDSAGEYLKFIIDAMEGTAQTIRSLAP